METSKAVTKYMYLISRRYDNACSIVISRLYQRRCEGQWIYRSTFTFSKFLEVRKHGNICTDNCDRSEVWTDCGQL